jgi:microcystin degradation protein MlrC
MKRVGIIALLHESNTFIDEPTTLEHFRSNVLVDGPAVIDAFRGSSHEVGGFIEGLTGQSGIETVGIFAARAMPFGPIDKNCWLYLMQQLERALSNAGQLDGILVAPHGATVAESAPDADGAWLEWLRNAVGPTLPIIGTLDLHANVSARMVKPCQALFGYRTNPHLDQFARGKEAAEVMVRTLSGAIQPKMALVQLPLCANIERQATSEPHGVKLWNEAERITRSTPGLISLSCLYGFPYSDVEEMGSSVIAVSDRSEATAQAAAKQMADFWWNMRDEFAGKLVSVRDAIAQAVACRQTDSSKPVGLLEMGDNVGGGSPGDGTWIAHGWLQFGGPQSGGGKLLTVICDPAVVQAAVNVGVGNSFQTTVGGRVDPARHGPHLEDVFQVVSISDGTFSESQVRHGGYSNFDQGQTAVLAGGRGITVIATTIRVAPLSLQQVLSQGVQPTDFAAIVLKGVHAPVAAYESVCSKLIRVNTLGVTTADLGQLEFLHRRRPMEPFERMERWL